MQSTPPSEGESTSESQCVTEQIPADDLATLLKVTTALASSFELTTVLQTAIESAVRLVGLDTGTVYTLDRDTLFVSAATPPLPPEFPHELRIAPLSHHPHLTRCFESGRPVLIADTANADLSVAERKIIDSTGLRTILFVPLMVDSAPRGAMIVGSRSDLVQFRTRQIDMCLMLASQMSLAVANAILYGTLRKANQELAQAYDETILGWAHALEMRDFETRGHAERVTDLTLHVARRLGIHEHSLPTLRHGAILHDIGKMIVPDCILCKAGPLTDDEWDIMRAHPEHARELLSRVDYLAPAIEIPYCHHERWDGSGYPQGLAGEEIPLPARIFAVIDVYDALTSDRPYRPAWSEHDALEHIREKSGTHFDPQVASVFLEIMEPQVQAWA